MCYTRGVVWSSGLHSVRLDEPETSQEAAAEEEEEEEEDEKEVMVVEEEGHGWPEGPLAYTTERELEALPPYLQKTVTRTQLNDAIACINRHLPGEGHRAGNEENHALAPLAYNQLDECLPGGAWCLASLALQLNLVLTLASNHARPLKPTRWLPPFGALTRRLARAGGCRCCANQGDHQRAAQVGAAEARLRQRSRHVRALSTLRCTCSLHLAPSVVRGHPTSHLDTKRSMSSLVLL
jgi:hypothetical protein